jgi:hypothetical protein
MTWAGVKRVGEALQPWGSMIGVLAVPVVLAVWGALIQQSISDQGVRKDYVALAVQVLSMRPVAKQDPLRKWAVDVINKNSNVPLTPEVQKGLLVGEYAMRPTSPLVEPGHVATFELEQPEKQKDE